MKRTAILMAASVIFWGGGSILSEQQEQPLLPGGIQEFYRDYNFVCAFTTPAERMRMAACLEDGILPGGLNSKRHVEVFARMKRIVAQVHIIDSEMVIPPGSGKNLQKVVFRQELFEVRNFRRRGDEAGVDVFAYSIEPEVSMRYIAEYEKNEGKSDQIPSGAEVLEAARSRVEQRQETHNWKYLKGRWVKTFANFIFLKRQPL